MGDKTFDLLESIKNHPCIYNFNLPNYSQREMTNKAWNEVAKENNTTVSECKEKWKNLRYGFLRSMKLNPDGSAKRKYYLHDFMEFVLPYLMPKQNDLTNMMSVECDTDEENNEENIEKNNNDSTNVKTEVNIEEQMENGDTQELFDFNMLLNANQSGHIKPQPKVIDDSRRMFLLSLLPEVNVLTESQMRVFRRKVFTLIDEIVDTSNQCITKNNKTQSQITNTTTSLDETQTELINNHEIKMERL